MKSLSIDIKNPISLDDCLKQQLFFSRKSVYLAKQEKRLLVNGETVQQNQQLQPGDELLFLYEKPEKLNYAPIEYPLKVLYEDDLLMIVDKPYGYIVHSDGNQTVTVNNFVADYYKKTRQKHAIYNLHRLDKETSGCLLYCKEAYLVSFFAHQIEYKITQRSYLAWVEGNIRDDLIIDQPIARDRHVSNRFRVAKDGKEALTEVYPLKQVKGYTLVRCVLQTGRTHQIRVHLSSIGHPIVGDSFYGAKENRRMMLHSYEVQLFNPLVNDTIRITALPDAEFNP